MSKKKTQPEPVTMDELDAAWADMAPPKHAAAKPKNGLTTIEYSRKFNISRNHAGQLLVDKFKDGSLDRVKVRADGCTRYVYFPKVKPA